MGKHSSSEPGAVAARVQLAAGSRRGVAPEPLSSAVAASLDDQALVLWGAETGRIKAELSAGYLALLGGPQRAAIRTEVLASAAGRYQNAGRTVELEPHGSDLSQVGVSASVAALAKAKGVQLAACRRSGPGCTVTEADVLAEATRAAAAAPAAPAAGERLTELESTEDAIWDSLSSLGGTQEDETPSKSVSFARNPMAEQFAGHVAFKIASRSGQPMPTLFSNGDLPAVTASGIDPQMLLRVPWSIRHALAAADRKEAQRILEEFSGTSGELHASYAVENNHPGNDEYLGRFSAWMAGIPW